MENQFTIDGLQDLALREVAGCVVQFFKGAPYVQRNPGRGQVGGTCREDSRRGEIEATPVSLPIKFSKTRKSGGGSPLGSRTLSRGRVYSSSDMLQGPPLHRADTKGGWPSGPLCAISLWRRGGLSRFLMSLITRTCGGSFPNCRVANEADPLVFGV